MAFDYARYENRVLPFLWMKGEDHETIAEYLAAIAGADIHEVCLESRPHPDFCGDGWWSDLGFIIEKCKELGLKIWILDDAHFPTGYANGAVKQAVPELRKLVLTHRTIDVVGPTPQVSVALGNMFDATEEFYGVVFMQGGEPVEVNYHVVAGDDGRPTALVFDAPAGHTQACVLLTSEKTAYNPDYINMVDKASCDQLITAVYEPHYQHFGDEFGHTILGFFSDEPGFANEKGITFEDGTSDCLIGKKSMPLPWSAELERRLRERWGEAFLANLCALWGRAEAGADARVGYMEEATRLYEECFCGNLGDWCRAHGVSYIGHVIEDKDGHARLGAGAGHYFRAVGGQDMAGVDVVINQVVPGIDSGTHDYGRGSWDMEFYAYALAKLGASAAHLDPKKQGRCMAEVFGAFGWHEGLRQMKWICDHFLVRGVNWFVPHAFSMAPFPDPDCPPHFYAHGKNPQFKHFHVLMSYLNRMGTVFSGGRMATSVAVLYHADAEWAGAAQPIQRVAAELGRAQIDYDFVPAEAFSADGDQGRYQVRIDGAGGDAASGFDVNGQRFSCLVVPGREFIAADTLTFIARAQAAGVPVYFVDTCPEKIYGGDPAAADGVSVQVISLSVLAEELASRGLQTVACDEHQPWLRACRYEKNGETYVFLVNEHPKEAIHTKVYLPGVGALTGAAYDVVNEGAARAFTGELDLAPYESVLVCVGEKVEDGTDAEGADTALLANKPQVIAVEGPWGVDAPDGGMTVLDELHDLTFAPFPGQAGEFTYRTTFELADDAAIATLDLGDVYEVAEVTLDGRALGARVCPPYRFDAGELAAGPHKLEVRVINTLDHAVRDMFALTEPSDPSGLIGPVSVLVR
ncbi:MAG: glycoside hydrolase family 2 [Coriobacteriia bacterium]|nr:glycoside hydrolase family 2 [Coriobacteriia bacterium]